MKQILIKSAVLCFSVSLVSCYLWFNSEKTKPNDGTSQTNNSKKEKPAVTKNGQATDAEVQRIRDAMMQTSKSGAVVSDETIRAMIEAKNQKNAATNSIISSSKNTSVASPEDEKKVNHSADDLLPSSKLGRPFTAEDLEEVNRQVIEEKIQQRSTEEK